jgi:hypothetical protein
MNFLKMILEGIVTGVSILGFILALAVLCWLISVTLSGFLFVAAFLALLAFSASVVMALDKRMSGSK